jgi:hypothetical protein
VAAKAKTEHFGVQRVREQEEELAAAASREEGDLRGTSLI